MNLNNLPVTNTQKQRLSILFNAFDIKENCEFSADVKRNVCRIQPDAGDDNINVNFTVKEIYFNVAHNIITVQPKLITRKQFQTLNESEYITNYFIHANKNLNVLELNIYD
jgi:hypothetical protein